MPCSATDPFGCVSGVIGATGGNIVGGFVSSAWQQVCQSFADAASSLLKEFAKAFAAIPDPDLSSAGIKSVFGVSLGIAAVVAALLLIGQVIRTGWTHDGSALVTAMTGIAKAALAFLLTVAIGTAALAASDGIASVIVQQSFRPPKGQTITAAQELSDKLGDLFTGAGLAGANPALPAALLLIFGIVGILLVIVLWFELLLRNAAIAVLIATSPIAAAGQLSETTKSWWHKLVSATIQLIILKPVIALVFAVGLNLTAQPGTVENLLEGMLVLVLAVFAWPAVARFFAFANVQVAGTAGLGALLGFAAGRAAGGGGGPAGVEPSEFSRRAEQRTAAGRLGGDNAMMPGLSGGNGLSPLPGAAGGGQLAGAGAGQAAGAGGVAAAGPAGIALAGARVAQRAVNSLTGHMEQMAGHAGMPGANPYAQPAGTPRYAAPARNRYPSAPGSHPARDRGAEPPPPGPEPDGEIPGGDVLEPLGEPDPPLPPAMETSTDPGEES
jgi:hypothetical protein